VGLTLDQLSVLDAIDRLGSFAAAAEELHRATSAVSYAIRNLEEALGLTLFDRTRHRAALTPAGRLVLDEGRELLARAKRLGRLADDLAQSWEPRLFLVVDGLFPLTPILRALSRFEAEGAPTRLSLRVEHLGGVEHRFVSEDADLMLVLDFKGGAGLRARAVAPVEMVLVARDDHPIRQEDRVDRAALSRHTELTVEDSRPGGVSGPGRLSLGSSHVFRLSDFHGKRLALLEGVGFGWMPRHLVIDDLDEGRLAPLGFEEGDRFVFTPHLVSRVDPPLGRAGQRVVEMLMEELSDC
jgi:DNA-binding transcriptional LysR family regulator